MGIESGGDGSEATAVLCCVGMVSAVRLRCDKDFVEVSGR